ncbi:oxalurate catabolism protein HpxZ [Oxalobacteraceae bacterium CAVE-383]|nr:oxalurate catabolism protein HpxZ [Oxalobacteraceae bacterium CAVE-383]
MEKTINDAAVLADFHPHFDAYERALVCNDIAELDRLFWNAGETVRYGAGENLYGYAAIREFRMARSPVNLDRTVIRKAVTSVGDDVAVTHIEFTRAGSDRIGRQSQTWVKFHEGWRVISAHVSVMA